MLAFRNRKEDLKPVVTLHDGLIEYAPAKGLGWKISHASVGSVTASRGFFGMKNVRLVGPDGQEIGVVDKFGEIEDFLRALVDLLLEAPHYDPVRPQLPDERDARYCLVNLAGVVRPPWKALQASAEMVVIASDEGLFIRKVREENHDFVAWTELEGIYERPRSIGGTDPHVFIGWSKCVETPFPTLGASFRQVWEEAWQGLVDRADDPFRLEFMYAPVFWDKNHRGRVRLTEQRLRWGPLTLMDLDDIADLTWENDVQPLQLQARNGVWYSIAPFLEMPDLVDALLTRLFTLPFFRPVRDRLPSARIPRLQTFRLAAGPCPPEPWLDLLQVGDTVVAVQSDGLRVSEGRNTPSMDIPWEDVVGIHYRPARGMFGSHHGRLYFVNGQVDLPLQPTQLEALDSHFYRWAHDHGRRDCTGLDRVAAFRDQEQRDILRGLGETVWGRRSDGAPWVASLEAIGWVSELDAATGFSIRDRNDQEISLVPAGPETLAAFDWLTALLVSTRTFARVRGAVLPRVEDRAGLIWLMAQTPRGLEWEMTACGEGSVLALTAEGLLMKPTWAFRLHWIPWGLLAGYYGRQGRWRFFEQDRFVDLNLAVMPQAMMGVIARHLEEEGAPGTFQFPTLPCENPRYAMEYSFELERALHEGVFREGEMLITAVFGITSDAEGESLLDSMRVALDSGASHLQEAGGLSVRRLSAAGVSAASSLVGRRKKSTCELFLTQQRLIIIFRQSASGQATKVETLPIEEVPPARFQDDIVQLGTLKVRPPTQEMGTNFVLDVNDVRHSIWGAEADVPEEVVEAPPPPAPPPAPTAEVMEKLRNLHQLNSDGVLTDEEFAAAKAYLLRQV